MKRITTMLAIGTTALFFTACGGSGGGDTTQPPTTQPPETISTNGLWEGTQTVTAGGDSVTYDAQYIIYDDRLYGYSYGGDVLFSGIGTVSGTSISSNSNIYDFDSGVKIGTGTVSGTVDPQSTISGTFENSFGQSGTLDLTFNTQYNKPSAISKIAYNYGTFSIDASGNIDGTYNGCDINGKILTPDTSVNIYEVEYTLGNCGAYTGYYEGLGTITTINTPTISGEVLQAGMSNDTAMGLFVAKLP